jgi:arsenite-transporting ATPase
MAIEETLDAARSLWRDGVPVARIIVNQMTAWPSRPCRWCLARRRFEQREVATLTSTWRRKGAGSTPVMTTIDRRSREPVGVRALASLATEFDRRMLKTRDTAWKGVPTRVTASAGQGSSWNPIDSRAVRLVVFGGKGGVGKTTCAAAVALELATRHRDRRVLLLSVDPAHSLADVLTGTVERSRADGPRNLDVRELDAVRGLRRLRTRYAAAIDRLVDRVGVGSPIDMAHDRRVLHDLINLAPPGLDELVAILEVTERLWGGGRSKNQPDLIVMDTAPTGHALRLLEMPALVHEWTRTFMQLLLKYRSIAEPGELGALLLELSQALGRLRALLTDPERALFVVVTRAAAVPTLETDRLLTRLSSLGMAVPAVVVNAVGRGSCLNCRRELVRETKELDSIARMVRARVPNARLLLAPATVPAPRGSRSLVQWRSCWRALCA